MKSLYKCYELGDMQAVYIQAEEHDGMELVLLPRGYEYTPVNRRKSFPDSLVQIKLLGDAYGGCYAPGRTMRQSETTLNLHFLNQHVQKEITKGIPSTTITTELTDNHNHLVRHVLTYLDGDQNLFCYSEFENQSDEVASLELLSSFSLSEISPFVREDEVGKLIAHRIRSVWSMEGRLESTLLEDFQLEPSWAGHAVRCERYGQVGSMPVNGFFPYIAIEDSKSDIFWGAQIMHNASWQMELYRRGDELNVSGGLADYDFGHWMKNVAPGEVFTSPTAILSVCHGGGIDRISQRLTSALTRALNEGPSCEQSLPVMFNEYCTTWGDPSHKNICNIVNAISGKGFAYFVIDAGWYRHEGIPWDHDIGEYEVSPVLFPDGLDKTTDYIRSHGMKPGLWFEIDNVGFRSLVYQDEEHLLHRGGKVLSSTARRFRDLRQSWVQEDLKKKVIDTLKKYDFSYIKMDYNDTIGVGCDGCESLGEGLRTQMEASLGFIRKIKAELPGIIMENCSSGGHKLEPLLMSECAMASFSDAHECEEIPIIAANLHRVILPRQSQIWAVVHKEDSLKRIGYSIANTFLGRMCLSGDVLELSDEQWKLIDDGIAFYNDAAPIIRDGFSKRFGPKVLSYRHPSGWQGMLRYTDKRALVVVHAFYGEHDGDLKITLPSEFENANICRIYSDRLISDKELQIIDDKICIQIPEDMRAVSILLQA